MRCGTRARFPLVHDSVSPAGFERFFRELSDMTAVGARDPADIVALAERYELPFAEPDWLLM